MAAFSCGWDGPRPHANTPATGTNPGTAGGPCCRDGKYANHAEHADVVIVGAAPASDDLAPLTSDWVDATVLAEPADVERPLRVACALLAAPLTLGGRGTGGRALPTCRGLGIDLDMVDDLPRTPATSIERVGVGLSAAGVYRVVAEGAAFVLKVAAHR